MPDDLASSSYNPGTYSAGGTDWDAVANTTFALENNATLYAQPDNDYNGSLTVADVVYYSLSAIALLLFCFCTRSRIPDERYRMAAAERRARWLEREERKDRMSDPNYRENLVSKALVIRKVIEEKDGQLTLGDDQDDNDDDQSSGGGSRSIDSTDENVSTCVICLEAFRVGDVVAWSRKLLVDPEAETCNHVFHKECILSWLMQPTHDDCPSCRTVIVHEEGSEDEMDERDEILPEGPDPYSSSAFVIMHGLVSKVRRASYSLIGQSINIREDDDLEAGNPPPKPPPSPMRRVFSLEGTSQRRRRSSSLRQRPSVGSVSARSVSLSDVSMPNVTDSSPILQPPLPPPPQLQYPSPPVLRRVVSDVTRTPALPLTRESSGGRRFPLPFRQRGRQYQRVSSITSDNSECSLSERSLSGRSWDDEEEIVVQQVSFRGGIIGQSLSDPTDEDTIMEDEPC